MQKVFSNQEITLNDEIAEIMEWNVNEKGEYTYLGFPIIVNGRILLKMEHKMYHLSSLENHTVFRPFRNLRHTYFISDFIYENEIADELIKSEEGDDILCIAKKDKEVTCLSKGMNEAEAKSILLLYLESHNLDEDEINELVEGMRKFNLKGQERALEQKEKQLKNKKKK